MSKAVAKATTHVPSSATSVPGNDLMPLMLGGLGILAVFIFVYLMSGSKKMTPQNLEKAKKKYMIAVNHRLQGKVDHYSELIDIRNLVTGFYEQKGNIVAARFVARKANCKRCKSLNNKIIGLLDPSSLATCTPPVHNDFPRGELCEATFIPIRAAEMKAMSKSNAKQPAKAATGSLNKSGTGKMTAPEGKSTGNLKGKKT